MSKSEQQSRCALPSTRRQFLKMTSAAAAVSSLSCWTQALAKTDLDVLGAKPAETLDKSVKVVNTYHEIHCHGQCMLKAHVKNGRLLALTSAGDVPRCEAAKTDESIGKMQRRACMKGYAERKRLYAPDRLKYPLLQTIERGNLAGFKRISWDEAIDRACEHIEKARARQKELGYIPIWEVGSTPLAFLGPYVSCWGHHSAGNEMDALFNALGKGVNGHPSIDMLNSKFIIVWGADPQTTSPHLPFIMTKAREKGIPIVVVDPRYTGTVGAMATGAPGITPWIAPRPGTDSAILAAMANTIYRRGLHDEAYIRKYCFGFFPGDTVVSHSPAKIRSQASPGREPHLRRLKDSRLWSISMNSIANTAGKRACCAGPLSCRGYRPKPLRLWLCLMPRPSPLVCIRHGLAAVRNVPATACTMFGCCCVWRL